ncbi:hypothetical protein [Paenarthrobacter nitroguajacolicus]|nr:hypothetical protein [Paenarthrobacter nitroguajacolicus]
MPHRRLRDDAMLDHLHLTTARLHQADPVGDVKRLPSGVKLTNE